MIALALLLAGAEPSPIPPVRSTREIPSLDDTYRERGFTEAGIAILTREDPAVRAEMKRRWRGYEASLIELRDAIRESPPDFRRIAERMRQRDVLMTQINAARTERLITLLEALPPADRILYLRFFDLGPSADVGTPRRFAPSPPPAPPPPPR